MFSVLSHGNDIIFATSPLPSAQNEKKQQGRPGNEATFEINGTYVLALIHLGILMTYSLPSAIEMR